MKETAKAMPSEEVENISKQTSKLVIPTPNGYSLENKDLIIYCEGMGNYSKIYLSTGKEMIMSKTLKAIELLLGDNFCRIHKSYLVNINHILRYSRSNGYKITMTNDSVLDVSYRNNETVLQILKKMSD
jgi:two-component system LytT family response regulator